MQKLIAFMSNLDDDSINWILSNGKEVWLPQNSNLIEEDVDSPAIHFVLQGLLGVFRSDSGETQVAVIGPGEIVGEMSFVDGAKPSASVRSIEATRVLSIPKALLQEKVAADPVFAGRFFLALATALSQRLRVSDSRLKAHDGFTRRGDGVDASRSLMRAVEMLKQELHNADNAALKNHGVVPVEIEAAVSSQFGEIHKLIHATLYDDQSRVANERIRDEIGARLQREMLPYVLLAEAAERAYSKPRGYAGDYLTIETIYQNTPRGRGRIGPLIDRCFLNMPCSNAVRNRKALLADEIRRFVESKPGRTVHVTSLGSGPAAEVFEVFSTLENPGPLVMTLVDMDLQALAFVADKRDRLGLTSQIKLLNGNLALLALGRGRISLKDQDFIYSIGLLDYFDDKLAIKLIDWIHGALVPGGTVMIGNFHPRNSSRGVMERILDWKLIHRREEDMDRLFLSSAFRKRSTQTTFENEQINLFTECIRG